MKSGLGHLSLHTEGTSSSVVELAVLLGGRVLVLLVLGNKVVHVALCLGELHLVYAFGGPLAHLLNRCVGAKEPKEAAPGVHGFFSTHF